MNNILMKEIEVLRELLSTEIEIQSMKETLKKKERITVMFLVIGSLLIYMPGILIYKNQQELIPSINMIVGNYISKEVINYYDFKVLLIWSFIVISGIMHIIINWRTHVNKIKKWNEELDHVRANIRKNKTQQTLKDTKYCNVDALGNFVYNLRTGRAETLRDCMNYYTHDMYVDRIINELDLIKK